MLPKEQSRWPLLASSSPANLTASTRVMHVLRLYLPRQPVSVNIARLSTLSITNCILLCTNSAAGIWAHNSMLTALVQHVAWPETSSLFLFRSVIFFFASPSLGDAGTPPRHVTCRQAGSSPSHRPAKHAQALGLFSPFPTIPTE